MANISYLTRMEQNPSTVSKRLFEFVDIFHKVRFVLARLENQARKSDQSDTFLSARNVNNNKKKNGIGNSQWLDCTNPTMIFSWHSKTGKGKREKKKKKKKIWHKGSIVMSIIFTVQCKQFGYIYIRTSKKYLEYSQTYLVYPVIRWQTK